MPARLVAMMVPGHEWKQAICTCHTCHMLMAPTNQNRTCWQTSCHNKHRSNMYMQPCRHLQIYNAYKFLVCSRKGFFSHATSTRCPVCSPRAFQNTNTCKVSNGWKSVYCCHMGEAIKDSTVHGKHALNKTKHHQFAAIKALHVQVVHFKNARLQKQHPMPSMCPTTMK